MLRRYASGLVIFLLAVAMLGAAAPEGDGVRFNKLGHEMMCVCGCGQILLECNHVGCPDSSRMIGELHNQVSFQTPIDGGSGPGLDSRILNWFVAKYGATVLAAPIRGGFDNVAWIIPISIFILAIFGTAWVVRLWSQKRNALKPAMASGSSLIDNDLRARIRRETEY